MFLSAANKAAHRCSACSAGSGASGGSGGVAPCAALGSLSPQSQRAAAPAPPVLVPRGISCYCEAFRDWEIQGVGGFGGHVVLLCGFYCYKARTAEQLPDGGVVPGRVSGQKRAQGCRKTRILCQTN